MAMAQSWHVALPAEPNAIPEAADWIASCLAGARVSERLLFRLNLCVEELLMNTIHHGVRPGGGLAASVRLDLFTDRIVLVYEDNARPFDVTKAPKRQMDVPLTERAPGGVGLELLRSFSDAFSYQEMESGNQMTCVFSLGRE